MVSLVNDAFMKLVRRAEGNDRQKLVDTFVDAGPLFTLISSQDHQVMYGRRGTGKTHALTYLAESKHGEQNAVVYLDMRTVGSTGGLYADAALPLSERATRLLIDTLLVIHEELLDFALEQEVDLSQAGPILDRLLENLNEVRVSGDIEVRSANGVDTGLAVNTNVGVNVGSDGISLGLGNQESGSLDVSHSREVIERGAANHRVHFGSITQCLRQFVELLDGRSIWIILDEWSDLPLDLQPFLADLLRRSVFPVRNVTVKIGAIEHRSLFRIPTQQGDYIGIELGADAAADVNLDDFMVFDNDERRAKTFFQEFVLKHFLATAGEQSSPAIETTAQLIRDGFTQRTAFDEFVRAVEGVPRDAINILTIAAQRALDAPISVPDIRTAARLWYQRDKEPAAALNQDASALLHWLIDVVIGERRARAFLLRSNVRHPLIDSLFDARVLHILKRSIASHDEPGIRYDVYKLDFGCYVDLIATAQNPQGLLPADPEEINSGYVEVPPDDYRSIRRAILDLDQFERRQI